MLLLAPGGMKSSITYWDQTPWDPRVALAGQFRVIAMDQRNAGKSSAPVSNKDGWHSYTNDQLALMDYLSIERFHAVGMCIGGPFCLGLAATAPERLISGTIFQTIGVDKNRDIFFHMFDIWAANLKPAMPDVPEQDWDTFRTNMYGRMRCYSMLTRRFSKAAQPRLWCLRGMMTITLPPPLN